MALLSLKGPVRIIYHSAQGVLEGKDETKVGGSDNKSCIHRYNWSLNYLLLLFK